MNKRKNILSSAKKALSKEISSIKTLTDTFNNNFYKAVELIHNIKGRVIVTGVGKSAHVGNKVSATLTSTGTPSYFIHATEASHGDLGNIKKGDCVIAISNSGETSELNNIIEFTEINLKLFANELLICDDFFSGSFKKNNVIKSEIIEKKAPIKPAI